MYWKGRCARWAAACAITGLLIDAVTGTHLWADRFDGSLEDIFELQDLIDETTPRSLAGAAVKLRRLVDETSALAADRGSGEVGFGPATSRGDLDHG